MPRRNGQVDSVPRKRRGSPPATKKNTPDSAVSEQSFVAAKLERERQDARYRKLRADRAELELAVDRGRFHSIDDCRQLSLRKIAVVKRRLLSIDRELAPHLVGLDARQIAVMIRRRMQEIIQGFADGR